MKKRVLVLLVALSLPFFTSAQSPNSGDGQGTIAVFLKAISELQEIRGKITQNDIALKYEQNLSFPSLIEIERIDKELQEKHQQLEELEDKFKAVLDRTGIYDESDELLVESLIRQKQEEIAALEAEKAEYEERYNNRKAKQQENIKTLRDQFEDLQEEKDKQWKLIRTQGLRVLNYTVIIVGLMLFFYALQWIGEKVIRRFFANFNEHRQKALIHVNRIIFNAILLLIILGLFFSHLSAFLPFLAILGTGLAFAVRDTISSFIGWFVVGGDRGYRVGHIVQIKDTVGEVLEVKPLVTVLKELKQGAPTGHLVTLPNKVVFEDKIIHHSHNMGLVPLDLNFLLSEKSDLEVAIKQLEAIIHEANGPTHETIVENTARIIKQTPFTEEDFETRVWFESVPEGLYLRARFLVTEEEYQSVETNIKMTFVRWVQRNKKVFFQFTNVGRHS